ncbi:MAG: hypothetical protein WA376_04395, partial [Terrimicrobiaceae bacterium]
NEQRKQAPDPRGVAELIRRKSKSLLRNPQLQRSTLLITGSCDQTVAIPDESVALVVPSPPFLR